MSFLVFVSSTCTSLVWKIEGTTVTGPRSKLVNVGMIVFGYDSSYCGCPISPTKCARFELSSIYVGAPCDCTFKPSDKFPLLASVGEFSSNSSSSSKFNVWKLEFTGNHFRSTMSKICVPLNSSFLVMSDLWGLSKLRNLLGRLLNTTPT